MNVDEKLSISIVTPTYNRCHLLPRLYESLLFQTTLNFDWIVIDDGSNDGTSDYIDSIVKEGRINVYYLNQENGGKVRALNRCFSEYSKYEAYLIIDSDDYLLPDAVACVKQYLIRYQKDVSIGAYFFNYKFKDGKLLKTNGKMLEVDCMLTRQEYNRKHKQNDGCVCYLNRVIREYKYPEYPEEKYVAPTLMQLEMANKYKILFSPMVIGVAEYQNNGLTKAGRALRLKNPLGMIHYASVVVKTSLIPIERMKYAISIWPYAKIAKKSFVYAASNIGSIPLIILSFVPGLILSTFWLKKNNFAG